MHLTLYGLPALSQEVFNQFAELEKLPFSIVAKLEKSDVLNPSHLRFDTSEARNMYVVEGNFSEKFKEVYTRFVQMKRRVSVANSLAEGRPVDIITDVSNYPANEKKMLSILLVAAKKIELLFMKQMGTHKYIEEIEKNKEQDPLSHKLFWRNQTPIALTPKTQSDTFANAHPAFPKPRVDVYPLDVNLDDAFCKQIETDDVLKNPFSAVVRDAQGKLISLPYHLFYPAEMEEISRLLAQAAAAIAENKDEKALCAYLKEASRSFLDSNWDAADLKWVALNMGTSKYALRVAPDETYWDPANLKAGFEFWLGRVNDGAASFAKKIAPYFQEMENHLHELIPVYQPRTVPFECPDFVDMMFVAGDHRSNTGAVVGQKLPNGQGKPTKLTVMTNYYLDPQSLKESKEKAKEIFVEGIARDYEFNAWSSATGTLLHEVTHGLGPRGDEKKLGGQNTQIMEELKAQTGALYWIGWLRQKNLVSADEVNKLYLDAINWCFGHISRGMVDGQGHPKTYSQLAAIQIRHFMKTGAMTVENGLFNIHYNMLPAAVTDLFKMVLTIQIESNVGLADALRNDIVEGGVGNKVIRAQEVKQLFGKFPKVSFNLELKGL